MSLNNIGKFDPKRFDVIKPKTTEYKYHPYIGCEKEDEEFSISIVTFILRTIYRAWQYVPKIRIRIKR